MIDMARMKSPYSAAVTGGGFLFEETDLLLPLLMSPDKDNLLKNEILHNNILHIFQKRKTPIMRPVNPKNSQPRSPKGGNEHGSSSSGKALCRSVWGSRVSRIRIFSDRI